MVAQTATIDSLASETQRKDKPLAVRSSESTRLENERVLIELAAQGNHGAFTSLVKFHDRRIMNVILRFTLDQYDRDDLYQEIFTACYAALPSFSGKSSFHTWLYRIAMNHCISFMRKQLVVEELDDIPDSDPNRENQERLKAVAQAMSDLDGPQRVSFHLFYIEQWTLQEVADVLECSTGTIKSHLDRARKKIRQDKEVAQWLIQT